MAAPRSERMGLLLFVAFGAFLGTNAVEEVVIVHAPESIKFLSSEPVQSSYLGDIFSAMFAYTVRSNINWQSLGVVSPWNRPEAAVVLELLGFNSKVDMPVQGTAFLLENKGDIARQFDLLSYRTLERFLGKRPVLLHMDLGGELHDSKIVQPRLLKSIPANPEKRLEAALDDPELSDLIRQSTFNVSAPSDTQLLTEMASLKEFLRSMKAHKGEIHDGIPDVYWLKIGGLQPVVDAYGPDSIQFREALRLIRQMISEVETTMRAAYDDNVIVAVMKVDDVPYSFGFQNRKLLEVTTETVPTDSDKVKYNLADMWDPDFPVVFTIMAFISITMFLSVLAISLAMWHMDPGKDSIIYRATQRMKRD